MVHLKQTRSTTSWEIERDVFCCFALLSWFFPFRHVLWLLLMYKLHFFSPAAVTAQHLCIRSVLSCEVASAEDSFFFLYLSLTPWATFYINTAAENLLESQSAIALRRPWLFAGKCWRRKFKKSFQTPGGNDSAELRWELFWHGSTSLWQWLSLLPAFCVRQFLAAEFKYLVCTAEQRDYRHLWEIYMQPARRRCSARCIISIVSGNLSTMNYLLSAEATASEVLQKKKLHGLYFLFSC